MSPQTPLADLRAALQALRATQVLLVGACQRQEPDWRHVVVACRRDLARQLGELTSLLDRVPAGAADEARVAFRRTLSRLRSVLAEHQALWPAVAIDVAAPGYQASLAAIRVADGQVDQSFAALERAFRHS